MSWEACKTVLSYTKNIEFGSEKVLRTNHPSHEFVWGKSDRVCVKMNYPPTEAEANMWVNLRIETEYIGKDILKVGDLEINKSFLERFMDGLSAYKWLGWKADYKNNEAQKQADKPDASIK